MLPCLLLACTGDTTDGGSTPTTAPDEVAVCAPDHGPFSADVTNPYSPWEIGAHHVLEGLEGGTEFGHFETTVLDETEDVAGVTTRVVRFDAYEHDDAGALVQVETARDFFAQAPDGTVCLYGEDIDALEDGEVVGHEGWLAGEEGAFPGIVMPAEPAEGTVFTQIYVPPDDIEEAEVTIVGESVTVPAATFDGCLEVLEDGPSLKKYAPDVGQIYDDGMELVSY